ncbi:hypothetical protein ABZ319_37080 [Nocardia sp. NPDC005978]|uniref:hypothetical protein n=1 Tax=Nocardia sp. NPDC005978 TaxID=3156725 RepID=UPI0033B326CA
MSPQIPAARPAGPRATPDGPRIRLPRPLTRPTGPRLLTGWRPESPLARTARAAITPLTAAVARLVRSNAVVRERPARDCACAPLVGSESAGSNAAGHLARRDDEVAERVSPSRRIDAIAGRDIAPDGDLRRESAGHGRTEFNQPAALTATRDVAGTASGGTELGALAASSEVRAGDDPAGTAVCRCGTGAPERRTTAPGVLGLPAGSRRIPPGGRGFALVPVGGRKET